MRNNKSYKRDRRDYEDDDGNHRAIRKRDQTRRRPIRNWTKVWEEHQNDIDTLENLYDD
jgi:hypothetical protein